MNVKLEQRDLDKCIRAVNDENEPARAVGAWWILVGWFCEGRNEQLDVTPQQMEQVEAAIDPGGSP